MSTQIQFRRGTAAAATSNNPTLAAGEVGLETDTGKIKVGDGTTAWNSLPYLLDGLEPTPLRGIKGSDQSITEQTTYENDAQLTVPVAANALYAVVAQIDFTAVGGVSGGNFRYYFDGPAAGGATARLSPNSGTPQVMKTLDEVTTVIGESADRSLLIRGSLKTGANAGDFGLMWSQSLSSTDPTIVRGTSFLELRRLA